jgi:3'-phosphoadenosine 5'-phosphosulfate sulfotransferase (PAPS reductase)/FAD synthetase
MEQQHYDKYIVAFSGGKDSIACFLHLLESGVPKDKIELWHHDIDGHGEVFMDWEVTPAYCRAFATHFGVPIYFSWKEGGFKREMLRNNQLTAPTSFEDENKKVITVGGTRGKKSTRLKFPQVSPDLTVRWCSAYLKIDVCAIAIRNQKRFDGVKICVISGERGEESAARSKYAELEPDRADNRKGKSGRYVDRIRPIKNWLEQEVWGIIERWKIRVHPAYYMGWSRVSCKFCIFGNANQFASANFISPKQGSDIMNLEEGFGCTIKHKQSLRSLIASGKPYDTITDELVKIATSLTYKLSIVITDEWVLPAGAYGEGCGPT